MRHDEAVKCLAYRIWEEEGRPDGRALDHWLKAEAFWDTHEEFEEHRVGDVSFSQCNDAG